jgi:hypothetical protein
MKKKLYISSWILLGILLSFILHGVVEIPLLFLFSQDKSWMLGFSWQVWYLIHYIFTFILLVMGMYFGFRLGKFFWRKIYEK